MGRTFVLMGRRWIDRDIAFIKRHYKTKGNLEIGNAIDRTPGSIKKKMQELGIKRTPEELHNIRVRLAKRPNDGQFKKGRKPHNTTYDGYERITKDGYKEVRIKEGVFVLKHRYEWEKCNGPIEKGYCLRCKDGNIKNTDPSNWFKISMAENAIRTHFADNLTEDGIKTMVVLSKLNNKIKRLEKWLETN